MNENRTINHDDDDDDDENENDVHGVEEGGGVCGMSIQSGSKYGKGEAGYGMGDG